MKYEAIQDFTELEMQDHLELVSEIIDRNQWNHLILKSFPELKSLILDVQDSARKAERQSRKVLKRLSKIK